MYVLYCGPVAFIYSIKFLFIFLFIWVKTNFKWGIFRWHFSYRRHLVGAKTQKFSFSFPAFKYFTRPMPLGPMGLRIFENITCIMANAIYLTLRIFTFRALFGVS